ncbi:MULTISPECIES: ABC transporter substrate-binding protein [unclassified Nocardiopsis]|uniref:ABC transporter substrate-binding protein n=1 Tax=unclassified Nocardiopsis TaxID=2649073 RepID=UPI0013597CBA|nr:MULTISPECIES: ABC transporter substrate-binding protein [unclassified Nocardiopsis]
MNLRSSLAVPATVCALALTACSAPDDGQAAEDTSEASVRAAGLTAEPVEASLSITDPRGTAVELDAVPERVVCLVALCDDILLELGLEPAASTSANLLAHPAYLGEDHGVPIIPGGFGGEDVEEILRQEPDLVIGLAGSHEGLVPALSETTTVWLTDSRSWNDSVEYLRNVAALTDRGQEQAAAEQAFYDTLAQAQATAAETGRDELTPIVIYGSDGSFQVDSRGSIVGGLLGEIFDYPWEDRATGGHQAGGSDYSMEEILAGDPDVIFLESFTFSPEDTTLSEQFAEDPVWNRITAVRNGDVHEVDLAPWATGRGTRALTVVIEDAMELTQR